MNHEGGVLFPDGEGLTVEGNDSTLMGIGYSTT